MPLDSLGYLSPVGYVETKIVDADGEVLRRAADIIERRGWCQNDYQDGAAVCILGALRLAITGNTDNHSDRVHNPAERLAKNLGQAPWVWNDEPGRTKEEVIAALRSAAEQGAS